MNNFSQIMGTVTPPVWIPAKKNEVDILSPDPLLLYGLELEIERVEQDMAVNGMVVATDGSLRNNGLEFITRPMYLNGVASCLQTFFTKNRLTEDNYSERTSIHVHTNCNDLTPDQVASVCVLYQVFEKVLFSWIGNDREANIFCVPWSETTVSYQTVGRLVEQNTNALRDWNKYTALNLAPLTRFGTIEWRHMNGHSDMARILLWCQLIGCLFAYCRNRKHDDVLNLVINLNTTSQYMNVLDTVFGSLSKHLKGIGYETLIEDGVLNMKYSIAKPPKALKMDCGTQTRGDNIPRFTIHDDMFAPPPAAPRETVEQMIERNREAMERVRDEVRRLRPRPEAINNFINPQRRVEL